jgi:hypothetical protein
VGKKIKPVIGRKDAFISGNFNPDPELHIRTDMLILGIRLER